jgi:transposase InsO family protein
MVDTLNPKHSSNELMGWKETCVVEERFRFVQESQSGEWSFSELCRRYGVSRPTGYKWLERYEAGGLEGLRDQSRAPHHHPNEILDEVAEGVLDLRRQHPHWGPLKLHSRLQRQAPEIQWPAPSTIGEMLNRAGLAVPRKQRRKATPSLRPVHPADRPNQVWSADFKGWFRCGDGSRCDPLTISDGHSRFLLRCQALDGMHLARVRPVMEAAFREHGMPERILTDNGEPFGGVGLAGLSGLSVWWIKLGIQPVRIQPGKPQQNGRHERMHRTLKQATAKPPAATLRAQQKSFDRFREEYNWERPHEALAMQTPGELYVPSNRTYPSRWREPEFGSGWETRRVGPCGRIRWWSDKIFIGKALVGEMIGMEPVADGEWKLWFFDHPLAIFYERSRKVRKLAPPAEQNACGSTEV